MKTPVQWSFDLQDALDVRDLINSAIHSGKSMVYFRTDLRGACDELHELCQAFEREGLAEEYSEHYLCLFDALSHFTEALRFGPVNVPRLRQAANELDKLFSIETPN